MRASTSKTDRSSTNNSRQALGLILPICRQHWQRLVIGFIALLCVDFLQLSIPRVIKRAVDGLQGGSATLGSLLDYGLAIMLLAGGIAFFRFGWRYLILGFSRILERELRGKLFHHLLTLDRMFFQRRTTGEIMALSSNDLAAIQLASGMGWVAFVDAVVMTVAALGFMAYIHPTLTIIAIAPMPILALLTRFLAGRLHKRFKKVQEQFSKITEFARSSLSSVRLIKAYTQEECQNLCFDRLGRAYVRDNLKLATVQGTLFPVSGLVANISLLLVLYFGGRLTVMNTITMGDFTAFITYLFMLTWPMMAFGWVANLFQRGITSLARIQEILEERPVLTEVATEQHAGPIRGEIRIAGLTFTHRGHSRPALRDISLEISPGVLGMVGRSGSGKSTLCQILARIYPIPEATVFLDNIDVNRLALDRVRGSIAYVPQDILLFGDTIGANIALGRPGAGRPAIEAAARAAALHDEIMAMDRGYDTRIGEKGVTLSGGQRQRIALARALLLDRPILIIDDGLSAVDTETEQQIIKSISTYLQGRTCIIVSHRVAPLAGADSILVLDEGRIAARGSHRELLAHNPYYARIHEHQMHSTGQGAR